jgi:Flp pilus assembly pilin Flp
MRMAEGFFSSFIADDRGAAIHEYAIVAAFFALATIATLQTISANATWQLANTQNGLMNNAVTPP